jgi:hypothetical protein
MLLRAMTVASIDITPLLEGVVEALLSHVPPLDLLPLSPDWLLVVLVCLIHLFVVVCCSVWLCRSCLVYVADALQLLFLSRRMLGHRWIPWRMFCHRCQFALLFGKCLSTKNTLAPSLTDALSLEITWSTPTECFATVTVGCSSMYLFWVDTLPPRHSHLCWQLFC